MGTYLSQANSLFSELAFCQDNKLFYLEEEDRSSPQCYLAYSFQFNPLVGGDITTADKLNVLLNQSFPDGTLMQCTLWSSPDLHYHLKAIDNIRKEKDGVYHDFTKSKITYLNNSVKIPLDESTQVKLRDMRVFITCKIPVSQNYTQKEYDDVVKFRGNTQQILKTLGAYPHPVDVETHLRMMGTVFNWKDDAEWKRTELGDFYDEKKIIANQIMDLNSKLEDKGDYLEVNGKCIKVLSPKRFPEFVTIGMAMSYIGDIRNGQRGIKDPFMITQTLYFNSPEKIKQTLEQKRAWIIKQSHGPILDFVPHLVTQKRDMDDLFEVLDKGDRAIRSMMTFAVFGDDKDSAEIAATNMKAYYQELGFTLLDDEHFIKPLFLNLLPFGTDCKLVRDSCRYSTLGSSHIARLMPVMGDWKGTGTAAMQFVSRGGQLMNINLFDSGTNFNAIIAAQSGSGKSFLTNDVIMSYLSMGAKIWVIDVGRSYLKLAQAIDGTFMEFTKESHVCLNPFDIVKDYDDECDVLIGLLSIMAAPQVPLDDFQVAGLRKTLKYMWDLKKNELTVDDIAEKLMEHSDQRVTDIGVQLYSFTSKGEYGKYFVGKNNTSLNNPFTVLELEELKGRKHLQQVVLMQLIYQIQQEMYLGDRSRPKLLIIDEAWDLLTNGSVAKFIEDSYRRVRKYGGAAIVVTQSVNDLYNNPGGQAIAENSANIYLLKQKSEVIDALKAAKKLPLPDGGYELLKTVHTNPGQYSEIFFMTEMGFGIGKLYVNRFCQLLYTTKADEVHGIDQLMQQYDCDIGEAINYYIEQEKGHN